MNYSNDTRSVRVDFFKPSGKWYATEAVVMTVYERNDDNPQGDSVHYALAHALEVALLQSDGSFQYSGMRAVCLTPHHKYAHPIQLDVAAIPEILHGRFAKLASDLEKLKPEANKVFGKHYAEQCAHIPNTCPPCPHGIPTCQNCGYCAIGVG